MPLPSKPPPAALASAGPGPGAGLGAGPGPGLGPGPGAGAVPGPGPGAGLVPRRAGRHGKGLTHEVVEALGARLKSRAIRPGDKLPTELVIMQTFGVSRGVVREALSRLQAAGLVQTHHGVGTFALEPAVAGYFGFRSLGGDAPGMTGGRGVTGVTGVIGGGGAAGVHGDSGVARVPGDSGGSGDTGVPGVPGVPGDSRDTSGDSPTGPTAGAAGAATDGSDIRNLLQLLELRTSIESDAAALAATRRSDAQLADMQQALADFAQHLQAVGETVAPDFRFHLAIAQATGNRYFSDLMGHLGLAVIPRTRVSSSWLDVEQGAQHLHKVNQEHQDIYAAIARQDPDAARAAMRIHLVNSRERQRLAHALGPAA